MTKTSSLQIAAQPSDDARSRQELQDEPSYLRMENACLKELDVLVHTNELAARESERKSCLS